MVTSPQRPRVRPVWSSEVITNAIVDAHWILFDAVLIEFIKNDAAFLPDGVGSLTHGNPRSSFFCSSSPSWMTRIVVVILLYGFIIVRNAAKNRSSLKYPNESLKRFVI